MLLIPIGVRIELSSVIYESSGWAKKEAAVKVSCTPVFWLRMISLSKHF